MKGEAEHLFQELLECTDALIRACRLSFEEESEEDDIANILAKREELLQALGEQLANDDPEKYMAWFEKCREKERAAEQLIVKLMEVTSQKLRETRQSRSVSTNYNAYTRIMPYGAFIDQKK